MKNHQTDVLLIYYKRKDGIALTWEEEQAWKQYREKYPRPDEALFDERKLHGFARLQRHMPSLKQFKEKYNIHFPFAFPIEKQPATVQNARPHSMYRRLTVAASLFLLAMALWWYWPGKETADTTSTQTAEASNILPGRTKATLYLADGRAILLDTTAQGQLALQGTVGVYASQQGQVTYSPGVGKSDPQPVQNRMVVPRGGEYQLVLADGTKVWLNAASSFSYPVAFGDSARVVKLDSGEVYFEVSKQAAHQPFIVLFKGKRIEVLGTHFNVNAYDDSLVATLVEGSVRVTDGKKKMLLHPGQQALMNEKGISVASSVDIRDVTAWKNKYFSFHNTRLSVIMDQLGRWYDVEVVYKDPLNDEQFVVGEFSRSAPLQYLLDDLEESKLVHFKVEGRKIIISK